MKKVAGTQPSVSQHQRQKNDEQTRNRMRSRVLNGYWVFHAPIGYEYKRIGGHGKVLVRQEPITSYLQGAFEGFASGRFETEIEVKRVLESFPDYPKNTTKGEIRHQRVHNMLNRSVYAGRISYIPTDEGWLYLASVKDLATMEIFG